MLLLKVSYLLGFLSEDGRSISGSAVWWKIQNVHQAMHCVTFGMHHCSCETILCPPQHINNSLNTHSRYLLLISCIGFSITSFVRTFNICCHVGFSPFLLTLVSSYQTWPPFSSGFLLESSWYRPDLVWAHQALSLWCTSLLHSLEQQPAPLS